MAINPVVMERLRVVLTHFEGVITWMYMDTKALVSTGVGFLMEYDAKKRPDEPPNVGHNWPWSGGQDFTEAWYAVKARTDLIRGAGQAFESVTSLRLTEAWVRQRFAGIAEGKVTDWKGWDEMKDFDTFPLDAQLGVLTLGWGALKREWRFTKAVGRRDWRTAARESLLPEFTAERKAALRRMFTNAAVVDDHVRLGSSTYSRSTLYYPVALTSVSEAAIRFRMAVDAQDWGLAYQRLNGLSMTEMLLSIKNLAYKDRELMWGVRGQLKGQSLGLSEKSWLRIEFAFTVVRDRRIPLYSLTPTLETTSPAWTDEHWGIPPEQVTEAVRFLARR